jgi:hypothetical protein
MVMHPGGRLTGARGNKTVEQVTGEPWLFLNFSLIFKPSIF